jgi:cytochrome P450 family 20 subfamily A
LPDISKAGSFHAFLMKLHATYGPIASFWYGEKLCVSLGSADVLKQVENWFDRPGEKIMFKSVSVVTH